mgnify:CR=1 FL=1
MEAITPTLTDEQAEFLIVLASVARCKPGSINLRSYPDASLMLDPIADEIKAQLRKRVEQAA